ncbi:MAG: type 1 glutamine amidotransferase-like domain-containing protein [Acidimicrobiaceae bacterium]|nr:type 1 glutamine amidotransferase-like domain-containing protein [Acidimicrobiaceae bacterium]
MTESPRILTIMGSGETSPTMVKTHRENFSKISKKKPLCVILDTPFGFQRNAGDIAAKAIDYFKVSLNVEAEIASFRSALIDRLDQERFFSKLSNADFIFSGPGSPTYALRQWKNTQVPKILANKLVKGPVIITFSSAASLTLGSHTIPVYEIYKVGEEPEWAQGLDILGIFGIKGAIIPHFNNTEGGNHDTRFCYLGEDRLTLMESMMNPGESIFGIDEHTAIVIDLDTDKVSVTGNGTFTIRNQGRQVNFESGTEIPLQSLIDTHVFFRENTANQASLQVSRTSDETGESQVPAHDGVSPLLVTVEKLQLAFAEALSERNAEVATKAILSLEAEIEQWQTETFPSDEMGQATSALRSMIVQLGELAIKGSSDPEDTFGAFVDLALKLRIKAREEKRWDESDQIREELAHLGIEVRDIPGGSEWISIGKK